MPNSSFAFPGSDHATFSKDFELCHLLTMRSVTTNRQASELVFFFYAGDWENLRAGENKKLWATSLKESETRASILFSFHMIASLSI